MGKHKMKKNPYEKQLEALEKAGKKAMEDAEDIASEPPKWEAPKGSLPKPKMVSKPKKSSKRNPYEGELKALEKSGKRLMP